MVAGADRWYTAEFVLPFADFFLSAMQNYDKSPVPIRIFLVIIGIYGGDGSGRPNYYPYAPWIHYPSPPSLQRVYVQHCPLWPEGELHEVDSDYC